MSKFLAQVGRASFNCLAILTCPVWGGPLLLYMIIAQAWEGGSRRKNLIDHLTGKKWILEDL